MARNNIFLKVAEGASDALHSSGAMKRVNDDGYSRIDPFQVATAAGVPVLLRRLDKLLGAFLRLPRPGILVNSDRSAGLIHMTCAHELGHFFLGHSSSSDIVPVGANAQLVEKEADAFAFQLLAPKSLLIKLLRRKDWTREPLNAFRTYQLSLRLGISYDAMTWTLQRLNFIDATAGEDLRRTKPAEIKKALLGVALPDSTKEVWLIDPQDKNLILEPRPEDHLVVRLKSHAGAGYLWHMNSSELAAEGFSLVPLPTSPIAAEYDELNRFGGPPTMDYEITGAKSASDTPLCIQLKEIKPFAPTEPAHQSFQSHTQFEDLSNGLARPQRIVGLTRLPHGE
ncbi:MULTISPECIES: ImmA/IrrE family metallo-endopeptidase [Pseudomonas syringae group]|uniref:ImmA/IrrE family metallo-endopeptidase n=1 Tax=Pseudomonas syringae group TaxID=136849 RepID=UPI000EFEA8FA|nr:MULTISPECIES: ImmA/IrrE family metallo-endopeptidase [Pseudomonas syringae group]RMO74630.1 hypothetical protein ALQ34_03097 [Pseudomonas syringae pv. maculicola]